MEELFFIPESIEENIKEENFYSEFTFGPLERGFGHTIGNALRRTLISSITGCAICGITVTGAEHKYSAIEGVKETVVDIVYNLKQVRFKVSDTIEEFPVVVTLDVKSDKKKELIVTADSIKCPPGVEVITKDAYIATIESGGHSLGMKIYIDKGKGLLLAENMDPSEYEIGYIPVDALFSPVERVKIEVDSNTRFRGRADYDTLKISVWTDGTVTPREAINEASEILLNHFMAILGKTAENKVEESGEEIYYIYDLEDVDDGIKEILEKNGIQTIQSLIEKGAEGVRKIKGIGKKGLEQIKKSLEKHGYTLE